MAGAVGAEVGGAGDAADHGFAGRVVLEGLSSFGIDLGGDGFPDGFEVLPGIEVAAGRVADALVIEAQRRDAGAREAIGEVAQRPVSARVFVPERRAQHRDAIARSGARRAVVPAEHGAGGVAAEMRRAVLEIERSALDADARLRAGLRVEAEGVALP